jgi:hypothetical protein
MSGKKRPTGITVLAILNVIIGFADFISVLINCSLTALAWLQFGTMSWLIGGILVLQGIVLFVLVYGFLGGKGWAWTLGLIFGIWDFVLGLILLPAGIIRIIYGALVIYYLMRTHVKAYFGKK